MTAVLADFFPVIVTDRPEHEDYVPAHHDNPAGIRIAKARDVREGDEVLASFTFAGHGKMLAADHFTDTYPAAPVPFNPDCGCPGHDALTSTGLVPATVVTDGFPWDLCDVWDADAPALIVSARRPSLAQLVALQPGSATAHDQEEGAPANVVRHPACGGAMFYVDGPYRCVQCWATLTGGQTRPAPGFEWRIAAGWLTEVETFDNDCEDCFEDEVCQACEEQDRPLPRMLTVVR
jgi:hypothetical protein